MSTDLSVLYFTLLSSLPFNPSYLHLHLNFHSIYLILSISILQKGEQYYVNPYRFPYHFHIVYAPVSHRTVGCVTHYLNFVFICFVLLYYGGKKWKTSLALGNLYTSHYNPCAGNCYFSPSPFLHILLQQTVCRTSAIYDSYYQLAHESGQAF